MTIEPTPDHRLVMVMPWNDPLVDGVGYDVNSAYVELFWLGVLGPSATWILRRFVAGLDRFPLGYEVDLGDVACALGLSYASGPSSTFGRALQRCAMFGALQQLGAGLSVRRRLPPIAVRHLSRLPADLQAQHPQWLVRECTIDDVRRARALARAMVDVGDERQMLERQLLAVGVPPAAATMALGEQSPDAVGPSGTTIDRVAL